MDQATKDRVRGRLERRYEELSETYANALAAGPSYSVEGQSVSYEAYLAQLLAGMKGLRDEINALDGGLVTTPWQLTSRSFPG